MPHLLSMQRTFMVFRNPARVLSLESRHSRREIQSRTYSR